MTDRLTRTVIEPVNPKLNVSRNANLPHSPGIRVGDYIFLSGMGPVDPVTGGRNLGPIAEQIRQTLRNMAHMLESAASGLDRIVKINVILADIRHYDEMNRVWREFFSTEPPARTTCALQLSNGNWRGNRVHRSQRTVSRTALDRRGDRQQAPIATTLKRGSAEALARRRKTRARPEFLSELADFLPNTRDRFPRRLGH